MSASSNTGGVIERVIQLIISAAMISGAILAIGFLGGTAAEQVMGIEPTSVWPTCTAWVLTIFGPIALVTGILSVVIAIGAVVGAFLTLVWMTP